MPSLLRIFLATDAPVEFVPHGMEDVEICRQQTDVVNYVIRHNPKAFRTFQGWFEDALVRRIGVIHWYHEEREFSEEERYQNLTDEQLRVLDQDPSVSEIDAAVSPDDPALSDALVKRRRIQHTFRYDIIPNEEFSWSPDATDLDDAVCVYWSQNMTVGRLVSMGFDRKFLEGIAGREQSDAGNQLYQARQFGQTDPRIDSDSRGKINQPVLYTRVYFLTEDEKGVRERRFFECFGREYVPDPDNPDGTVVEEMVPFSIITPRPLAHMIAGMSVDDFLSTQQRINSQLIRGMLDSLSKALDSDTYVDINRVSIEDVEDPAAHRNIRVDGPVNNAVLTNNHNFVGREVLPVLQWSDEQTEKKVGITKASRGLDADALQSATKIAVAGTLERAQERIDAIARAFAETGITRFFKGMLRMIVEHQDRPMVVRLRGNYIEVDPREWQTDYDCIPNVGLGTGVQQDRITLLREIATDQNNLRAAGVPFVTLGNMRRTREELVRMAGFMSADEFYSPWGPEQEAAFAEAQANAEPSADPSDMLLAQVEREKMQMQMQVDQAKLQIEGAKIQIAREKQQTDAQLAAMKLQLEQTKAAADQAIKMIQAQASAETPVTVQEIRSETDLIKTEMQVESQQAIAEQKSMDAARDRAANVAVEGARLADAEKNRQAAADKPKGDSK